MNGYNPDKVKARDFARQIHKDFGDRQEISLYALHEICAQRLKDPRWRPLVLLPFNDKAVRIRIDAGDVIIRKKA